jgi:hypothetical protein
LPQLLGEARDLARRYMDGNPDSLAAFRDLANLLLHLTVLPRNTGLRLAYADGRRDRGVLGGMGGPTDPVPLNDGRYLRVSVSLALVETDDGTRLKTLKGGYQYQADRDGKAWIFRYDYLREPGEDRHPQAHVQLRGTFTEDTPAADMHKVHFPTGRVSIEGVARLLADQFGLETNTPPEIWRPVLAESEQTFQEIAHRPLSGPAS